MGNMEEWAGRRRDRGVDEIMGAQVRSARGGRAALNRHRLRGRRGLRGPDINLEVVVWNLGLDLGELGGVDGDKPRFDGMTAERRRYEKEETKKNGSKNRGFEEESEESEEFASFDRAKRETGADLKWMICANCLR